MIDDLIVELLHRFEVEVSKGYSASFDCFVKTEFPRSYSLIQDDLKYWKESHKEYNDNNDYEVQE